MEMGAGGGGGGAQYIPRTMEEVFRDFKGRRAGLIKALTTDVELFYQQCDPEKENLCLYSFPNKQWEVNLPTEEVPPDLPEPTLGINFARDGMQEKDWLSLIAVHSDAWLLSVAFYFGARAGFDKADRKQLFAMINDLPTVFEIVTRAKKQAKEKSTVYNHSSNKSKSNSKWVVLSNQPVIAAPGGEVEATEEAVLMTASPTAAEAAANGSIIVMGTEPMEEKFPATSSRTYSGVVMTTRRIVPLTAKPSMPEEVQTREEAVPVTTSTTEEATTNGGTIVMATEPVILAFSQSVDSGSAIPDITSEATQEAAQSSPNDALSQDEVVSFIADLLASNSIAAENAIISGRSEIARRVVGLAEQLQQDHQNGSITDELLSAIAELCSSDVTAAQHALLSRIKRRLEDRIQDREDAAKALKQLENQVEEAQAVQKQSISTFSQQQAREGEANLEHEKLSAEVQALTEEIKKLEDQRMQKLIRMEALDQEKKANAAENARLVADYRSRGAHILHLQAEMEKHQGTFIELEGCLSSLIRLARELL